MKHTWKISVAALVAVTLSAPSEADDDKTRFESTGFLKSLDAFIVEQMAKKSAVNNNENGHPLKELELSLRAKGGDDAEFFRLSDSHVPRPLTHQGLSARSGFSSLLAPSGYVRGAYGPDVSGSNSRLNLSFGGNKNNEADRGFEVSIESAFRLTMDGLSSTAAFADAGLADREYNVGVTLGYSGFGLDASVTRQTSVFKPEISGFDVGFSYQSASWAARLSLSEYREGADLYGIENEVRNIVSVELGASYRLTNNIGFKGGVRYFDYGDQWLMNPEAGENSQMLFLGGQLKF